MSAPLVTRFAPSPTGRLHLGHLAHMIRLWGVAEELGARVLLRIEDHDRARSRPEYEEAILEDLDWLGFPYEHPGGKLYRQSDHPKRYERALARLTEQGLVYRCTCSRKRIAADSPEPGPEGERQYSGRCRDRDPPPASGYGLRVRLEPGVETFEDGILGPQAQNPAEQCGDLAERHLLSGARECAQNLQPARQ